MTEVLTLEITVKGELHVIPGVLYGKLYHEEVHGLTGLLMDVCDALEQSGLVEFVVGGFGEARWHTVVEGDLHMIVEWDLPVARWRAERDEPFHLQFAEQHLERDLELAPDGDGLRGRLQELERGRAVGIHTEPALDPVPKPEVRAMLTRLAEDFCRVAETACPAATRHPLYQQWRKELMQETTPRDLDAETTPDEG